jgi:uncharacterized protein YjiS (DUF1127 family)
MTLTSANQENLIMMLLKRMYQRYETYMIHVGREQARTVLLSRSDRVLSDLGFSRKLLESGIDAWPWEVPTEKLLKIDFESTQTNEKQAISELESLTDVELQDLGISRGGIRESVLEGRAGFEIDQERKVA